MYCLDCKHCSWIIGDYYESTTFYCNKNNRDWFTNPVEYYCDDFENSQYKEKE